MSLITIFNNRGAMIGSFIVSCKWVIIFFILLTYLAIRRKCDAADIKPGPRKQGAVYCYACKADFTGGFNPKDDCLIPSDPAILTQCSANSKYCQADVVRLMDVILYVERKCVDDCGHTCISKGYGATTETCTYCCDDKPDCGLAEDIAMRKWLYG